MKVYIGGKLGTTPAVVARSLEQAMKQTLRMYTVPSTDGWEVRQTWVCELLDADHELRHGQVTGETRDGERSELYVERFDLDEDEATLDEDTPEEGPE